MQDSAMRDLQSCGCILLPPAINTIARGDGIRSGN
jgi:hypothetical protein